MKFLIKVKVGIVFGVIFREIVSLKVQNKLNQVIIVSGVIFRIRDLKVYDSFRAITNEIKQVKQVLG